MDRKLEVPNDAQPLQISVLAFVLIVLFTAAIWLAGAIAMGDDPALVIQRYNTHQLGLGKPALTPDERRALWLAVEQANVVDDDEDDDDWISDRFLDRRK